MSERLRHRLPMSTGVFTFRVDQTDNGSLVASLHREPSNHSAMLTALSPYYNRYRHRYHHHFERIQDDVGALYYVVAVILIYGCSILMMIASYIRKNKVILQTDRGSLEADLGPVFPQQIDLPLI